MFMCGQCQEQFDDQSLAYSLILESRLAHPAADMYVLKFCSQAHVRDYLDRIGNQKQKYVLTKHTKGGDKVFEAAAPLELLLLVGSSKG